MALRRAPHRGSCPIRSRGRSCHHFPGFGQANWSRNSTLQVAVSMETSPLNLAGTVATLIVTISAGNLVLSILNLGQSIQRLAGRGHRLSNIRLGCSARTPPAGIHLKTTPWGRSTAGTISRLFRGFELLELPTTTPRGEVNASKGGRERLQTHHPLQQPPETSWGKG